MSEQKPLNIHQKLAKIRTQVAVLKKDSSGYGYKYVSEEHILAKVTGLMDKYTLSLIPRITPGTMSVEPQHYTTTANAKGGGTIDKHVNEVMVSAEMTWTWINNDNPEERLIVPWMLVGQQSDASQSFGSALTYASRYFLLKFFNIATSDDDPDKFRSEQKRAADADDQLIVGGIIGEMQKIVDEYLRINPDNRQTVADLAEKYIKGGNYQKIKDPVLAGKLLEEAAKILAAPSNT